VIPVRTGRRRGGYTPTETRWLTVTALGGAVLLASVWFVVDAHPNLGIDRHAFRLLSLHRGRFSLAHQHRIVGVGVGVFALISLVAVVYLAVRRRWTDVVAIALGYVVVGLLANVAKSVAQRPRPAHPLIAASGYSFPSSDSAISLGLVAVAFGLARLPLPSGPQRSRPRRRFVIVAVAVVITAVCDLGFVSLRVHYLTDVLAGWGLGALVFTSCALAVDRGGSRLDRRTHTG
jgi:membrane-associated phospholipid phosphatase